MKKKEANPSEAAGESTPTGRVFVIPAGWGLVFRPPPLDAFTISPLKAWVLRPPYYLEIVVLSISGVIVWKSHHDVGIKVKEPIA